MSHLQDYFNKNTKNAIHKWLHYFDIYEFWFKKYIDTPVVILEIGVYQGGSLNMWRNYFGKDAMIYAIDINPDCKQFETENTKIFIGSQEDRDFLKEVKSQIPRLDILIDDGGHTMNQQIVSFEELYDHIKADGIYLCEDLHTSYWPNYGGGYKRKDTFIEYSKNFVDRINAWNSKEKHYKLDDFGKSTWSLHYYPSVLVIQKRIMTPPVSQLSGEYVIPAENFPTPKERQNFFDDIIKLIKKYTRKVMKSF